MLNGSTKNKKKEKKNINNNIKHQLMVAALAQRVGWHSIASLREAAIGRAKKWFSDSDNNIFEIFT